MMREADVVRALAPNIAVKLPLTMDGLKACKRLTDDWTLVNGTICFRPNQALLEAKTGERFISPFVGRNEDVCVDGLALIESIRRIKIGEQHIYTTTNNEHLKSRMSY